MKGHMLWLQLLSDRKHVGLEQLQKPLLKNAFYASKLQEYVVKECSFRKYQILKITHADPDHLFLILAIA